MLNYSFAQVLTLNSTQLSPSSPTVRIPTLHHYDNDAHILIMDDGGLHNLKAWYPAAPASAIPATGAALGTWLAQLHHRTQSVRSRDHLTARAIYRYSYANLAAAFDKFGLDAALAREIDAEYGSRLATDDACVCHGDFWPGNVLVREAEEGEGEGREEGEGTVLSVVDWEITRRGIGATDVAQFAAEAYLLDRFCGGKGLLGAFVEAYVRAAKEQPEREAGVVAGPSAEEFVRRFVVHFGVHVAFWPTHVEWCGEEETGELVKLGREYLIAGRDADWWYVGRSPLAPILELLK
ncbi:kinase-like domain-containing protein [Earliella scabrosa]|nr:kinase-like domain-containing protein [Earliella scabrosa]